MKRVLKKMIVSILIIILLFNFVIASNKGVYADETQDFVTNMMGGIVGVLTWPLRLIAVAIGFCMKAVAAQIAGTSTTDEGILSPAMVFFSGTSKSTVDLLDVDFVGKTNTTSNASRNTFGGVVESWYYGMKLIAVAALLLVLIYLGIRMALATIASEKALYKKALIDWTCSLSLVFLLPYIMSFIIAINKALVSTLSPTDDKIKDAILDLAVMSLGVDINAIGATVVYVMICGQTLGFLIMYIKRMLTVGFLTIIAPLISITYAIDKLGDGKAQALSAWFKEYAYNILIQPFHCIIYCSLVEVALKELGGTGSEALQKAVLAIICLKFVGDAEKIVRKIFGFESASSLKDFASSAMVAGAMLGKAKNIGTTARKGINFASEKSKGLSNAIKKDRNKKLDKKAAEKVATAKLQGKDLSLAEARKQAEAETISGRISNATGKLPGIKQMREHKEEKRKEKAAKVERTMHGDYVQDKMKENFMADQMKKDGMTTEQAEANYNKMMADTEGADYKKYHKSAESKYDEMITNPNSAEYKKYHSQAVEKNKNGFQKISGFAGKVANSETGKYIRSMGSDYINKSLAAGVGLAIGGMAYGGSMGLGEAAMLGTGVYSASKELMQTSKGHLAEDAKKYMSNGGYNSKEDVEDHMSNVKGRGDNGDFEANSDYMKNLIKQLEKVIGDSQKAAAVRGEIQYAVASNPENFDLSAILNKHLGSEQANDTNVINAANNFTNSQYDSNLYKTIKSGEAMGLSVDSLAGKTASKISFSGGDIPLPQSPIHEQLVQQQNESNQQSESSAQPVINVESQPMPENSSTGGDDTPPPAQESTHEERFEEAHTHQVNVEKETNNIIEEIEKGESGFDESKISNLMSSVNQVSDVSYIQAELEKAINRVQTNKDDRLNADQIVNAQNNLLNLQNQLEAKINSSNF